MSGALFGDLSGLSMPRDLEPLRELARRAAQGGQALDALYSALAREQRMALLDLVIGPRALREPAAVRAALGVLDALEEVRPGVGLYRRLIDLHADTAEEVVVAAARRHPQASWLVGLAALGERPPGRAQLAACRGTLPYAAVCWAHAAAGHQEALQIEAAAGRPEPAAALLAHQDPAGAALAAAAALEADPACPVVGWLAATAGPELEGVLARAALHLVHDAAVEALARSCTPFPTILSALRARLSRTAPAQR